MTQIDYSGWFQCRLATDPDAYDEPRGVSGYVHAYVGEPDLDRVIRFQDPPFHRSHGAVVGVFVDRVVRQGKADLDHPLVGARVNLLGEPKYEGRNGVVADDGLEPVYPFELELSTGEFRLTRSIAPRDPAYPYPELFSTAFEQAAQEIAQLTGVSDLPAEWRRRRTLLNDELADAAEPARTALHERIGFLDRNLGGAGGGAARFFNVRMRYLYRLGSTTSLRDPQDWLPEATAVTDPWPIEFWFGGWDADLLCGFTKGTIHLGSTPDPPAPREPTAIERRP